jgi:hypothetical protein
MPHDSRVSSAARTTTTTRTRGTRNATDDDLIPSKPHPVAREPADIARTRRPKTRRNARRFPRRALGECAFSNDAFSKGRFSPDIDPSVKSPISTFETNLKNNRSTIADRSCVGLTHHECANGNFIDDPM